MVQPLGTHCFFRGPKLGFQHPHGSQPFVTPVSGCLCLFGHPGVPDTHIQARKHSFT